MKNFQETNRGKNNLPARIKKITDNLTYTSETDADIVPFVGKKAEATKAQELLKQIENANNPPVEEKGFAEFFARLTEIQDWFGDEEKTTARRFAELKNLLEQNLKDLKVFKIGKVEIDIFVVGLDEENKLTGMQTKAVET